MSEEDHRSTIRHILVALDTSHHSLAALEAAAALAEALAARLEGLFVEDINLVRLAGISVAREARYPFVTTGALDQARMERDLRGQAQQARRALATMCQARKIQWTFRVLRGEVTQQILEAAQEVDLLILGKASRPFTPRVRMGSTARAVTAQASSAVLLTQRGLHLASPVLVTYDGSSSAEKALGMALLLTKKALAGSTGGSRLTIAIVANKLDRAQELTARVASRLRGQPVYVRYRPLPELRVSLLAGLVRAEKTGLFVLPGAPMAADDVHALLDEIECPALVIR